MTVTSEFAEHIVIVGSNPDGGKGGWGGFSGELVEAGSQRLPTMGPEADCIATFSCRLALGQQTNARLEIELFIFISEGAFWWVQVRVGIRLPNEGENP